MAVSAWPHFFGPPCSFWSTWLSCVSSSLVFVSVTACVAKILKQRSGSLSVCSSVWSVARSVSKKYRRGQRTFQPFSLISNMLVLFSVTCVSCAWDSLLTLVPHCPILYIQPTKLCICSIERIPNRQFENKWTTFEFVRQNSFWLISDLHWSAFFFSAFIESLFLSRA